MQAYSTIRTSTYTHYHINWFHTSRLLQFYTNVNLDKKKDNLIASVGFYRARKFLAIDPVWVSYLPCFCWLLSLQPIQRRSGHLLMFHSAYITSPYNLWIVTIAIFFLYLHNYVKICTLYFALSFIYLSSNRIVFGNNSGALSFFISK